MDVQMPIMNGYEATVKRIRELKDPVIANISILAMTANAFSEDQRKKSTRIRYGWLLSKPIVIEELVQALKK